MKSALRVLGIALCGCIGVGLFKREYEDVLGKKIGELLAKDDNLRQQVINSLLEIDKIKDKAE